MEVTHDGEEGISKANSFQLSLNLLDIMMPKKNGLDTLENLKTNPDTKNIPVIMLTNLVGDENVQIALKSGAHSYITKSDHEPEQIVEIVKKILSESKSK